MKIPRDVLLYVVTFIVAACSIVYELLLAQTISLFCAHTVSWYALTIGIFLGGMGAGAFLCSRMDPSRTKERLVGVECALSVLGGISVVVLYFAYILWVHVWVNYNFLNLAPVFFAVFVCIVLAVGVLTGLELPLLIRLGKETSSAPTNRVLAADYFGSLAGAISFPLMWLPHFDLFTVAFLAALINAMIALALMVRWLGCSGAHRWKIVAVILVIVSFAAGVWKHLPISQYFLKRYYHAREFSGNLLTVLTDDSGFDVVERYHSPYQKIDIVRFPIYTDPFSKLLEIYVPGVAGDDSFPRGYALFLDGFFQFSSDSERIYHEYFAHVPIILNGQVPSKVLILGAGDGLLLRELTKYPEIREMILVELDPEMLRLAGTHPLLAQLNENALRDPRVKIVTADAYHYLKNSAETFDAVYIDFPDPKDYNLSKLYSREFYWFVKARLSEDGFAVMDAPGAGFLENVPEAENYYGRTIQEIYHQTLNAAGFETVIPYRSLLEHDNPQAVKAMTKMMEKISGIMVTKEAAAGRQQEVLEDKREVVGRIIKEFIDDYQHEFMMMKARPAKIHYDYFEPGVDLQVLNARRFALSVKNGNRSFAPGKIDPKKVNSIMRPTLPVFPSWGSIHVP